MTKAVTAEMIEAARQAWFEYSHPGKRPADVAYVAPNVGLVKAMIEAAIKASKTDP